VFQNAFAFDKETDARISQGNASCRPVEESSSDAALKVTDLATYRRLRDVERLGCSAKVQVFGYGYEVA